MDLKEKDRRSGPLPKIVLADGSDLAQSLPPIQADRFAELCFARALAEQVFGRPVKVEIRRRRAVA